MTLYLNIYLKKHKIMIVFKQLSGIKYHSLQNYWS